MATIDAELVRLKRHVRFLWVAAGLSLLFVAAVGAVPTLNSELDTRKLFVTNEDYSRGVLITDQGIVVTGEESANGKKPAVIISIKNGVPYLRVQDARDRSYEITPTNQQAFGEAS